MQTAANFVRASRTLERNRAVLDRCAAALLGKETLDEAALRELTRDLAPPESSADSA